MKTKMKRTISAVDDLPEEILIEILYRLGIKPLFRCRCVSKQLNSLISDPKFGLNYLQSSSSLSHLSALLYRPLRDDFVNKSIDLINSDSIVLRTDDDRPPSLHATLYEPEHSFYSIETSSDGLILVSYNTTADFRSWRDEICVSNPLTNQSVKLPTLNISTYRWACGIATRAPQRVCENQDSVTYKVVCIQFISNSDPPNSFQFATINIFSSETGRWTRSEERISCPVAVTLEYWPRLLTYKGILHYFDWNTRTILTYDPYDSPEGFGSIPLPVRPGRNVMNSGLNLIRLGLQDLLEFGEIEDCGNGDWSLCVWRLVDYDDKREWCLQNRCPINPQCNTEFLRDCRLLVAPDPLNAEFFCWLSAYYGKVIAHDLASTEEVCVDLFKVQAKWVFDITLMVRISLNPWSSPFRGEVGRNSSSTAGIRKIIPAWFPSYVN